MSVSAVVTVDELWKQYAITRDTSIRNELLMKYINIVKSVVYRMVPSYSKYVDMDDLMSCGIIGLIGAIGRFDINKGVNFETYAYHRVRGEIIDYLRKQDFISSNLRQKIKSVEKAFEIVENETGREATEQDVCNYLKISMDELRKILEDSFMYNVIYLDEILMDSYREPESNNVSDLPEKNYENNEIVEILRNSLESLTDKERLVITLYYYEEMTLKEIGMTINVTESRVSQIHSKALFKLRNKLKCIR